MKYLLLIFILIGFIVFNLNAETVQINTYENSVKTISSNQSETIVQFSINQFTKAKVVIEGKEYYHIRLPHEGITLDKGFPALPVFNRSIIIGDKALVKMEIFDVEYMDFDLPVAPSKGNLLRNIDPATVPYTFGDIYKTDKFYPESIASLSEPFILRDFRGITIKTIPFAYNPKTHILRVYTSYKVRVYEDGIDNINVYNGARTQLVREFLPIYERRFLNWNSYRYTSVSDTFGKLLIIYRDDCYSEVLPYFNWKKQIGIPSEMIAFSTIGTAAAQLQSYIQTRYNADTNITFVQIIGDHEDVPSLLYLGGGSDPSYALVAGSDSYPDIFVGRFSVYTAEQVTIQVNRTIAYERDPTTTSYWLRKAIGIASNQGPGDDGELDCDHLDYIRNDLITYGYTTVNQFYDPGALATDVITAVNSGRGLINYIGHGSDMSWGTTAFNYFNAISLTNGDMTPVIMNVACLNGDFTGNNCLAEGWLKSPDGGAIAMYASSINQAWNPPMEAQDEFNALLVADAKLTVGGLYFNSSCSMIEDYGASGVDMYKTWNIFGDASLLVRTIKPLAMSVTHPSYIDVGPETISVSTGVPYSYVSVTNVNTIYASGYSNSSGNIDLTLTSYNPLPCEYKITVTAHNRVTYIGTIHAGYIWTGSSSNDWSDGNNWNVGTAPGSANDVYLPAGAIRYPVTSSAQGYCNNLTTGDGTSVTVNAYSLSVTSDMNLFGTLNMNHSNGDLIIGNDLIWETGSYANINDSSAVIYCGRNMTFQPGSHIQLAMGYLDFSGASSSSLVNKSSNTQINHLRSNVVNPSAFIISSSSTQDILINGNYSNYLESYSNNEYTGNVIIKGNLTDYNTNNAMGIMWDSGNLVMDGISQIISLAGFSAHLNNLIISSSVGLQLNNNLALVGNLTIESGIFYAANWSIKLAGDWINQVGSPAFSEGTGLVVFEGNGEQTILTNETFYNFNLDNSSTDWEAFELNSGCTLTVLNNLQISDGTLEMNDNSVVTTKNLIIGTNAGLNAFDDTNLSINISGEWTDFNTAYTSSKGFYPGTSTVTFNGASAQSPSTNMSNLEFYNLVINKPATINLNLSDPVIARGNVTIISGDWADLSTGFQHQIYGNLQVDTNGAWISSTQNTLIMKGTGDASITYNGTSGSFYVLSIDKTGSREYTVNDDGEPCTNPLPEASRSQQVSLQTGILLEGEGTLQVDEGKLNLNGNYARCTGNLDIYDGGILHIDDNARVEIGDGYAITVTSGGRLEVIGSSGNEAKVTHFSTGNYDFSIYSGATIAARYTIFEYMTASGVNIADGAFIDAAYRLDNCTFRNGAVNGKLLTINNSDTRVIHDAVFPTNTWGGTYNVSKTLNQGHITFIDATGGFNGEAYDNDPNNLINWELSPDIDLEITAANWSNPTPYAGDTDTLLVTVINNGTSDITSPVYLDLYINQSTPPIIFDIGEFYIQISSVPPGTPTVFAIPATHYTVETIQSWLQIDTDEDVIESDEDNNIFGSFTLSWLGLPAVTELTIGTTPPDSVHLSWTYPVPVSRFNVYKDVLPDFIPGPGNLVIRPDSDLTEYIEAATGTKYFYCVCAERIEPTRYRLPRRRN